jgi:serine/threonine protein kinase
MGLRKGDNVRGQRGNYKIESLLGSGGLGRVWKARADNGMLVAIKEPLSEGPPDQVRLNLDKLRIEAVVLERLTGTKPMIMQENKANQGYPLDPNYRGHIVQFIDVDRVNAPSSLVLEFVNGKSIDDEFRSVNPSDFEYVEEYSMMILSIVRALHQDNILHRDISPHNLITTPDPEKDPVLIDFGTVKEGFNQLSPSAIQWSQIVKPGYSAPELGLGLASPSSDLYSVAATILFMYTGLNPQYLRNSAGDYDETRRAELQRIPRDRLLILKKALSYQPSDRFQTADDMLNVLGGRIIQSAGPHIVASGRKFLIRNDLIIGKYHIPCSDDCRRKGFSGLPDIAINDPESYISRHHARVKMSQNGECFIEDLHAVSGTAIRHANSSGFERLQSGRDYRLQNGDVIALAYSLTRGPYMTISFHGK